jgi:hypothetical protein
MLDKERHLRFSLKTTREMREEFGAKALEEEGLPADLVSKLLWFGLKHEDPELTIADVEEMIDLENLADVMTLVAQATGNRAQPIFVPQETTVKEASGTEDPQVPVPEPPAPADHGISEVGKESPSIETATS